MEPEAPPEVEPVMLFIVLYAGVELVTMLSGVPIGVAVGMICGLISVVKGVALTVGKELVRKVLTAVDDVVVTVGADVS